MSEESRRAIESATGDEKIVKEARDRFKRCQTWEADARKLFLDDLKFVNGDSDNMYQWPNDIRRNRDGDERPTLTVNKTRQHCLQIINDARQNKSGIVVRPVGEEASYDAAQVFENVIRHIEYQSNAQAVYDHARRFQVQAGVGYWRIQPRYADEDSFDQELFIEKIRDPLSVYIDPDAKEDDKSDMRFAFVFEDMPRDEFDKRYPAWKSQVANEKITDAEGWTDEDHVRVAEYYDLEEHDDELLLIVDETSGQQTTAKRSELPPELWKIAKENGTKSRPIKRHQVKWYKIAGDKIIERTELLFSTVPIVQLLGEETIIEGQLDRKGHTRYLKDPQRILNYWTSSAVEHVALQSKTPYIGPMRAFEGLETYWDSANKVNHAWLPYNDVDDDGQPIANKPERAQPPQMAPAYIAGREQAALDLQMVSGQYQAEMGEPSNEKSGKAINARQRQSENSTYHFTDHESQALRRTGRILIDGIPKYYDTKRVLRIQCDDGTEREVTIDPNAAQAYLKQQLTTQKVAEIFNPNVGKYEVEADTGPDYATRRQEAWNALIQILTQAPELVPTIGDLLFRVGDFPLADEIAQRLYRLVPKQALTDGPDPQLMHAQQQIQSMQQLLAKMADELATAKSKQTVAEEKRGTALYDAVTRRMAVLLKDAGAPPDVIGELERQMVLEAHRSGLRQEEQANATALGMLDREHQIATQPPEPAQPPGQAA